MSNIKSITIKENESYLRQISKDVTFPDSDLSKDISILEEYCIENEVLAMADVQLGIPKRIIYLKNTNLELIHKDTSEITEEEKKYNEKRILINPVVTKRIGLTSYWEACASCLNNLGFVYRPYKIEVSYLDTKGMKHEETFTGFESTVLSHELDHLDGILHIDIAKKVYWMNKEERAQFRKAHPYKILKEEGDYHELLKNQKSETTELKEKCLQYAEETLKGKSLELVTSNIKKFYGFPSIKQENKYHVGDQVKLKKGTYLHGIPGYLENFDWIVDNGFIGNDFTISNVKNKIKNSIGMWIIKEDCLLKDYIYRYSGFTITYTIGRGPESKEVSEMIPYHKFDEYTEKINGDENIWMYWGEGTKETRFLPSLVANKRQIAFILNMESEEAKELTKADVWNTSLDEETLKDFLDYRYYEKFLVERFNRNATTTDRETAIIFGLPATLIEGVLVGRKLEQDPFALDYIKKRLPDCYICNIDGKVIK